MHQSRVSSLYLIWIICLSLLSYPQLSLAAIEVAAEVIFAKGKVYAQNLQQQLRSLQKKSKLYQGDKIVTHKGYVQLRFSDGGLISFYDNTEFQITEYQFSEQKQDKSKALFKFVKGMYRTVLGTITQERYQVKTNIASIGTRGTEYRAILNDKLQIDVFEGLVLVNNKTGRFEIPAGHSALISNHFTQPMFLEIDHRGYRKQNSAPKPIKAIKPSKNTPPPPKNSDTAPPEFSDEGHEAESIPMPAPPTAMSDDGYEAYEDESMPMPAPPPALSDNGYEENEAHEAESMPMPALSDDGYEENEAHEAESMPMPAPPPALSDNGYEENETHEAESMPDQESPLNNETSTYAEKYEFDREDDDDDDNDIDVAPPPVREKEALIPSVNINSEIPTIESILNGRHADKFLREYINSSQQIGHPPAPKPAPISVPKPPKPAPVPVKPD